MMKPPNPRKPGVSRVTPKKSPNKGLGRRPVQNKRPMTRRKGM